MIIVKNKKTGEYLCGRSGKTTTPNIDSARGYRSVGVAKSSVRMRLLEPYRLRFDIKDRIADVEENWEFIELEIKEVRAIPIKMGKV